MGIGHWYYIKTKLDCSWLNNTFNYKVKTRWVWHNRYFVKLHKKGCITFDAESIDFDSLFEAAINLDAEDIIEEEGEYKVYTSVPNFQTVVEGLETAGFKSVSAEFTRVPQNTIEVTDEKTAVNIMRLLSRLEEHDDVQNVYANFDIDDELMEKIAGQI